MQNYHHGSVEQGFLLLQANQPAGSFKTNPTVQGTHLASLGLAPITMSQQSPAVQTMQGFDANMLQSMLVANGQPATAVVQGTNAAVGTSPQALMNALNLLQQVSRCNILNHTPGGFDRASKELCRNVIGSILLGKAYRLYSPGVLSFLPFRTSEPCRLLFRSSHSSKPSPMHPGRPSSCNSSKPSHLPASRQSSLSSPLRRPTFFLRQASPCNSNSRHSSRNHS